MPTKIRLQNILFLDIETVPEQISFSELSEEKKELFDTKTKFQRKEDQSLEDFYQKAGIWAEFGKIICISVGFFTFKNDIRHFRVTSFFGEESNLLRDFSNLVNNYFNQPQHVLCGHSAKEFDFPYIARRMIIHGLPLPEKLHLFGKKPWEVPHLDTMELWKFGDYKHYTSLKLLTNILNVPSPKDDIDGSDVARVFYQEHDIDRIINYCEKDVIAVAQIMLRLRRETILDESEIIHV